MELTKIEIRLTIDLLTEAIINWERDGFGLQRLKEVKLKLEKELNRQQIIALKFMSYKKGEV
tara:strand:- start:125 stop:310 length:186 start_codon:yes stop_codon:yes gene_type:complete